MVLKNYEEGGPSPQRQTFIVLTYVHDSQGKQRYSKRGIASGC